MTKSLSLNCRLGKWAILLSQYKMQFMSQKDVKGQAMIDFLADHLVSGSSKLYDDLSDEIPKVCMTQISFEEQVWQLLRDIKNKP